MALSTTKETTNFARISRLLVDGGTLALRNVFDTIHPAASLQAVLANHRPTLDRLKTNKILNNSQWDLLFPTLPSSPDSSTFDISLLVVLLRNICNLPTPVKGWDDLPPSTDTSVQDDIARIKFYRNKVYAHASKASLTDAHFADIWTKVGDALLRLGAQAADIDELKNSCMDADAHRCIREVSRTVQEVAHKLEEVKTDVKKVKELHEGVKMLRASGGSSEAFVGPQDATSQTTVSKRQLVKEVDLLLDNMQQNYKKREAFIHPFPWCEDFQLSLETIYTEVRIVSRKKEKSQLTSERCCLYDIFTQRPECESPRVVLLEGKPGMGKTVSCQKVTFDWSVGKTIGFLEDCKILLKLKCRDLESADIEQAIFDQLLPLDLTQEVQAALFQRIQTTQSEVLLVLDGLDELKEDIDLIPLIKGKLLPRCRVLLTSRDHPKLRQHCDALFQIIGFTPEHAEEFILKYFGENSEKARILTDRIPSTCRNPDDRQSPPKKQGLFFKELISSPLNTALLCAVVEDNGRLPSRTTQLYQELLFCVLTRYYTRTEQELPEDPVETHKDDLAALGRLALKGIENDRLHFQKGEFLAEARNTNILEFGLFSEEASASRIRPCCSYQFLHKTMQEFFAAISLSKQLLSGNYGCLSYLAQSKYRQITLFVVGLLSQEVNAGKQPCVRLVSSLTESVSNGDHHDSFVYVCDVVRECVDNDELKQELCTAIVNNFTWETLDLWRRDVSECDVEFKIVCKALSEDRPLKQLYLHDNKIEDVTWLAQSMEKNSTLKVLYLQYNPFTDASALARSLKGNTTLEWLLLAQRFIGDLSVEELQKQNLNRKIYFR